MDYTCTQDYYSTAFLSGCISRTISVHGPSTDKETYTPSYAAYTQEMKRGRENK